MFQVPWIPQHCDFLHATRQSIICSKINFTSVKIFPKNINGICQNLSSYQWQEKLLFVWICECVWWRMNVAKLNQACNLFLPRMNLCHSTSKTAISNASNNTLFSSKSFFYCIMVLYLSLFETKSPHLYYFLFDVRFTAMAPCSLYLFGKYIHISFGCPVAALSFTTTSTKTLTDTSHAKYEAIPAL